MANEEIDVLGQMVMARRVKQRLFGASAPLKGSRYVPIERIGQGGAGTVYRAYDSKLRREVAIKLLHVSQDDGIDRAQATQVMMREARSLAALSHPHVVAVHDVGRVVHGELVSGLEESAHQDGPVFLVMEYIEGQNLGSYIREKKPGYEELLSLFDQAAKGLRAAHEVGLVHRDFKPANVLVGKDGRVRVIDFGLAREEPEALADISTPPSRPSNPDPESSQHSGIVGTPAYMSPEARSRLPVGPKSDQYSFCVAFYEAVYGLRPLACTSSELPAKIPSELHRLPEGTPPDLDRRLAKGLQVDPDARYASLSELMSNLRKGRSRRLARWWPALVGPGLAIGAWMLSGGSLLGECRENAQALRIKATMQGVEQSFGSTNALPDFAEIKKRLLDRLSDDLHQSETQCTRRETSSPQTKRWLEFRLTSIDALNSLAQRGTRPEQSWRLRAWADEIAQDVDADDDEALVAADGHTVSDSQWARCLQALVQADSLWAQGAGMSGVLLQDLQSCAKVPSLPLVARIARRLDRVSPKLGHQQEAYFLAVNRRHADIAAEMAIRIGQKNLSQRGWTAASAWLEHAKAWHQQPLEKSCPALQNLSARVNLNRDPRSEHYETVLASWSDIPEMRSYRWELTHDYVEVLRGKGDWQTAREQRDRLIKSLQSDPGLAPNMGELPSAYLQLQGVADAVINQAWESAKQQLNAVPSLQSLRAEKEALSLWIALSSDATDASLNQGLDALQKSLLRDIQEGGCAAEQRDARWQAFLHLEDTALRRTKKDPVKQAQLAQRCPTVSKIQGTSLDLAFSRNLLSRLARSFDAQMNQKHPLQGRCPKAPPSS